METLSEILQPNESNLKMSNNLDSVPLLSGGGMEFGMEMASKKKRGKPKHGGGKREGRKGIGAKKRSENRRKRRPNSRDYWED